MEQVGVNQYLTFSLAGEQYAISIANVKEVLEYSKVTKLPKTASYMKGIINLRGFGIPVIDMRLKFGMDEKEIAKETAIIVLDLLIADEELTVGAIADSVHEVIELPSELVEPAPRFGTKLATEYICGVGKYDNNFLIILDINKIFSTDEIANLRVNELNIPKEETEEQK